LSAGGKGWCRIPAVIIPKKIWTGYRDTLENFEAWINITVMAAFDFSEISRFQIRLW
jgi:hypothetical protein